MPRCNTPCEFVRTTRDAYRCKFCGYVFTIKRRHPDE